jgi:hypothetical protein
MSRRMPIVPSETVTVMPMSQRRLEIVRLFMADGGLSHGRCL